MKKEKLIDYFLQLLMVVLGVFLGMMASEWSADSNLEKNKKNVLLGIKSEVQNNLTYLKNRKQEEIIPFFNSLDSLTDALQKQPKIRRSPFKDKPLRQRIPNFPGLGRPLLDDAMFEAAKFSNMLSNFDIELLKQLSKSYTLQYNTQETRRALMLKLIDIDSSTLYQDVLDLMWEIMQSFFGAQYNLIKEYEQTISLIDEIIER